MKIASANARNPTHLPLWSRPRHGLREEKGVVNKFERIPSFDLWFIFTTGKASWYPFLCLLDATWCHKLVEMAEYPLIIPEDVSLRIFEFLQKYHASPFSYQLPRHLLWSCHSYVLIQRCVFMPCSGGEETVLLSSECYSAILRYLRLSSSSDQISEELLRLMSLKTRMYKLYKLFKPNQIDELPPWGYRFDVQAQA